jgi:hypothetical protein
LFLEISLLHVNDDVGRYSAKIDLSIMALFGSMERTEKQWVGLLEKAGLSVVKVWTSKTQFVGSGTVFEAVGKD